MPLLSIIIPKKSSSTLEESYILPSIEEQDINLDEIEILICSSLLGNTNITPLDLTSLPKVNKVTKQYSESCFMSTPGNSRNIGIKHAKGDFVVFWDYDDLLADNHTLARLLDTIKNLDETSQCVECGYYLDSSGQRENCEVLENVGFFYSVWNYIFRKSLIDEHNLKFQSTYHAFEDTGFVWNVLNVLEFSRKVAISSKDFFYVHRDTGSDPNAQYHTQTHNPQFITDLFRIAQDYVLNNGSYPHILYNEYLLWWHNEKVHPNYKLPQWVKKRELEDFHYYLTYLDPDRKYLYNTGIEPKRVFFDCSIVINKSVNLNKVLYLLNDQLEVDYDNIEILVLGEKLDITRYTHLKNSIYFLDASSPSAVLLLSEKVIWINNERAVSNVYFIRDTLNKFNFISLEDKLLYPDETHNYSICTSEVFMAQPENMFTDQSNIKISFVIPYHNEGPEIYNSLFESLNNQTNIDFNDIEILICRGDNENIVPEISQFTNIAPVTRFIITQGVNGSPGYNRKLGLDNARGRYVSFLDIDDELASEDILSGLLTEIESNNYPDIIDMPFISDNGDGGQYYVDNKNPFQLWSSIYKLSFIRENQISFTPRYYGEDLTFVIEADTCNPVRYYYNKYFYKYKLRSNSAITQRIAKYELFVTDTINIYTDLKEWEQRINYHGTSYDIRFLLNIYPLLGRELNSQIFNQLPNKTKIDCIDIVEEMLTRYRPLINISPQILGAVKDAQDLLDKFISEVKI